MKHTNEEMLQIAKQFETQLSTIDPANKYTCDAKVRGDGQEVYQVYYLVGELPCYPFGHRWSSFGQMESYICGFAAAINIAKQSKETPPKEKTIKMNMRVSAIAVKSIEVEVVDNEDKYINATKKAKEEFIKSLEGFTTREVICHGQVR